MPGADVDYEYKTVQSIRGMEDRARRKWEADGWELVERGDPALALTKLTFRRPKKRLSPRVLVAGGVLAAVAVVGLIVGAIAGGGSEPTTSATPVVAATSEAATPSPTSTPTATASVSAVTKAEVLAAFRDYFRERAAANVMVGKAVTKVTFSDRIVRVTFDPAAAGVDSATFDQLNAFPNLGKFAATPIAFNDDVGNRLRPAIDEIQTRTPDGESLGTYTAKQILALNELDK